MALPNKYLSDKQWLYQQYIIEGKSSVDIGKIIDVQASSVLRALKKHHIPARSTSLAAKKRKGKRKFKAKKLNNRDWLFQKYIIEKLTSYQIANLAGTNQKSVFTALKRHDISIRTLSEAGKLKEYKSKYRNLENKEWLYQKYTTEKHSSTQMAKLIGCDSNNVIRALRKYGIRIRDNKESHIYVLSKSFYYDLLNDKKWLEQKYVNEKCSTIDMAKLCGAKTPNSVRQALMRHNIAVRNISEGLTCDRENDGFVLNIPVIDGSLLGDAGLGIYNKKSDISNPYFYKSNVGRDHIEYVRGQIFNRNRVKIKEEISFPNKKWGYKRISYIYYSIRSLSHKTLKPIYNKWYPKWNNYKKVIPEDIDISPISLLNWFMDDGNSYRRRIGSKTKQVIITLCTECFEKENQQMLADKINKEYGEICRVHPYFQGTGYRIIVPQSKADDFYNIIGECPVSSMEYKWK